jgi:hypothetical protein
MSNNIMISGAQGGLTQAQAKSLQAVQANIKTQHNSKDRMKQIMDIGGVAIDEDLAKIKRGTKKK